MLLFALGCLVAPPLETVDNIVSVEVIAVRPFHALAYVQRVFGGVVIDVPAFDQMAFEGEVRGVADHVVVALAHDVGHFRPVPGARVLHLLDDHLHLEDAALLAFLGKCLARRGQPDHPVGHRGRSAEGAGDCEEFAAIVFPRPRLRSQLVDVFGNTIPIALINLHD